MRVPLSLVAVLVTAGLLACGGEPEVDNNLDNQDDPIESCELRLADENGQPFETLSEYCFFRGELKEHDPVDGVVLYDVTAPLYSDRSDKLRFIVLPEGETIEFSDAGHWGWPDGSIIVKTFFYENDLRDPAAGRRILETRLLTKRNGEWFSDIYMWNEEQTEAVRNNLGRRVEVNFIDVDGELVTIDYRIPNRNQCRTCHGQGGEVKPLGPRTYQLTNAFAMEEGAPSQLEHFEALGMFDRPLPALETLPTITHYYDESATLNDRARSYLDANCAHCHNPDGRAGPSNLFLGVEITEDRKIGICKHPVAAGGGAGGLTYDIVPGHPEESIMIFRMDTTDAAIKMPELPLTTIDTFGVELISEWIRQMDPPGCN